MAVGRASSSSAPLPPASSATSARALRARRRDLARAGEEENLVDLPPDVLVHVLVQLPTIEDLMQLDRVCRLFCFGTPAFGRHSLVEAALRIRHFAHTGVPVPGNLFREPWWPWQTTKAKLVHDERCRRGARLVPLVPESVVNGDVDVRKGVVFFRRAAPGAPPPDYVLGRMTRAVDNGQGIQDPRVSRQHLRVLLQYGEAHQPNGVCRVQALGHNPSTIKRGKMASLGLGFHCEPPSFKLRRGDIATLYPGDIIQLVCEDVSRAHGRSLPFEGNACAYRLEYIKLTDTYQLEEDPHGTIVLGAEADDAEEEAASAAEAAGGASPTDAPETQQLQ